MQRQDARRRLADLADAKREDEPFKPDLASRLDGRQKVADRNITIAVKFGHFGAPGRKAEDVGRSSDPAELDELVDLAGAKPLDIEGIARDEMLQPFEALSRAFEAVGTASHRLALGPVCRCPAFRTCLGENKLGAFGGPRLRNHPHNLRDHITGPLDHHPVADTDVLAANFILVVKRRVRDNNAPDGDRCKTRHRCERAGPPDLDVDGVQQRLGLLGGKFVRQRPARRARHLAKPGLIIMSVDLVDDTVNIIAEIGPRRANLAIDCQKVGHFIATPGQRVDAESHIRQRLEAQHVRVGKRGADLAKRIGEELQPS